MPAPKSAAIKTKKLGTKAPPASNSLTTSLKKRMKKPKIGDCDKTVVKVVKGGVVKLIKTAKGLKVRWQFIFIPTALISYEYLFRLHVVYLTSL